MLSYSNMRFKWYYYKVLIIVLQKFIGLIELEIVSKLDSKYIYSTTHLDVCIAGQFIVFKHTTVGWHK